MAKKGYFLIFIGPSFLNTTGHLFFLTRTEGIIFFLAGCPRTRYRRGWEQEGWGEGEAGGGLGLEFLKGDPGGHHGAQCRKELLCHSQSLFGTSHALVLFFFFHSSTQQKTMIYHWDQGSSLSTVQSRNSDNFSSSSPSPPNLSSRNICCGRINLLLSFFFSLSYPAMRLLSPPPSPSAFRCCSSWFSWAP